MASLQKKGESWYCQFRYQQQRHTMTLGKVDEAEAQKTTAKIDYLLMRIRQRLLEVPAGIDIVTFIQHDGRPPPPESTHAKSVSFAELHDTYLETFGNGALEESTLTTARIHLQHLSETLGPQFPLSKLSLADLQRHIERRQRDVQGITIKKEIDTFRAAWNWGVRMSLAQGTFPSAGLVYPKSEEKLPFMTFEEISRRIKAGSDANQLWECLYLTQTEIAKLLDHVAHHDRGTWIYPAFVVAAHTGARRSELLRARPEDVDLHARSITIREKKRLRGRRSTRRVPLSSRAVDTLRTWMKGEVRSFLFSAGTDTLPPQEVQKGFHAALQQSQWKVLRGWHVLRHSFISALASRGVDQRIIDDFVGHQTEEQRRRYRHLYPSTQQQAIRTVFG